MVCASGERPAVPIVEREATVVEAVSGAVRVHVAPGCNSGAAGCSCGLGLLAKRPTDHRLLAAQGAPAAAGDRVTLRLAAGDLLRSAAVAYLVPLVIFLGAVLAAGSVTGGSDATVAAAGVAGLFAGFILARYVAKFWSVSCIDVSLSPRDGRSR